MVNIHGPIHHNASYRSKLMGSPTIPISFSKIEVVNGNYQVTPSINIGYGNTWFTGKFIFIANDKTTIDPVLFFGLGRRIDLFTISRNRLTTLGIVWEIREHKKAATPLSDE
jgi:hypothetical protein